MLLQSRPSLPSLVPVGFNPVLAASHLAITKKNSEASELSSNAPVQLLIQIRSSREVTGEQSNAMHHRFS